MPAQNPKSRTYRTGEVAQLIGVDRSTLLKWIRAGELPDVARSPNGYRVWTHADLRCALQVWRQREDARVEHCRTVRRRLGTADVNRVLQPGGDPP